MQSPYNLYRVNGSNLNKAASVVFKVSAGQYPLGERTVCYVPFAGAAVQIEVWWKFVEFNLNNSAFRVHCCLFVRVSPVGKITGLDVECQLVCFTNGSATVKTEHCMSFQDRGLVNGVLSHICAKILVVWCVVKICVFTALELPRLIQSFSCEFDSGWYKPYCGCDIKKCHGDSPFGLFDVSSL
jgi:hypothetical protein